MKLSERVLNQVKEAASRKACTPERYIEDVLSAHFKAELEKSMPKPKEVILNLVQNIPDGKEFTVLDVMDSLHKTNPKKRKVYGQMLSLLIARRQLKATPTSKYIGTYKVWVKG